jgi:phage gpG-like protein
MITVKILGDRLAFARFARLPQTLRPELRRATVASGSALQRRVQGKLSGAVLNVRTGNLRSSINTVILDGDSFTGASVGTKVRYARIHEYGGVTRPHVIVPKRGQALAFNWKGRDVLFARVNHPGSKIPERSFLRSSLREEKPLIRDRYRAAIVRALERG